MFDNIKMDKIIPTSKLTLKMSCLDACNRDVQRAEKLYNYIAEGLELPDTDPLPQTGVKKLIGGVEDVFSWIDGHQAQIEKGVTLYKILTAKKQ